MVPLQRHPKQVNEAAEDALRVPCSWELDELGVVHVHQSVILSPVMVYPQCDGLFAKLAPCSVPKNPKSFRDTAICHGVDGHMSTFRCVRRFEGHGGAADSTASPQHCVTSRSLRDRSNERKKEGQVLVSFKRGRTNICFISPTTLFLISPNVLQKASLESRLTWACRWRTTTTTISRRWGKQNKRMKQEPFHACIAHSRENVYEGVASTRSCTLVLQGLRLRKSRPLLRLARRSSSPG